MSEELAILPVVDFAYARSEEEGGECVFGFRTATGVFWFRAGAGMAKRIGRGMLAMIGEKPTDSDEVMKRFRLARADVRKGDGVTASAHRYGIDPDMLASWLAKLDEPDGKGIRLVQGVPLRYDSQPS